MKKVVIGIVVILALIIVIGVSSGGNKKETVTMKKTDLAQQVQKAYLDNVGYSSLAELNVDADNLVGSPGKEITSFVDEGSGQVQAEVQDNLTKQQATGIAVSIASSASEVKDLKTVFVHGINGVSSYANK